MLEMEITREALQKSGDRLYAHAVAHWNLPTNPVDFEQREGRVHRYKGHAVRRNLAAAHGSAVIVAPNAGPSVAIF